MPHVDATMSSKARFHVKHMQMNSQTLSLYWAIAAALALLLPGATQAGVQKCTGADGKVVFSDQPCTSGQTASAVRGVAEGAVPAATKTGSDGANTSSPSYEDMVQKSRRATVQAALTPECRALGDRASRALQNDSASLEEVKQAVSQFENQCGDQVQKASAAASSSRAVPDAVG